MRKNNLIRINETMEKQMNLKVNVVKTKNILSDISISNLSVSKIEPYE